MLLVPMHFHLLVALAIVWALLALEPIHDGDDGLWRQTVGGQCDSGMVVIMRERRHIHLDLPTTLYGGRVLLVAGVP
jgi:hypothetical protein